MSNAAARDPFDVLLDGMRQGEQMLSVPLARGADEIVLHRSAAAPFALSLRQFFVFVDAGRELDSVEAAHEVAALVCPQRQVSAE